MNTNDNVLNKFAKICFGQNNKEYRNFLIAILRMEEFSDWENIMKDCRYNILDDIPQESYPYMIYDYTKYKEYVKQYCNENLNMTNDDLMYNDYFLKSHKETYFDLFGKSDVDEVISTRQDFNYYELDDKFILENIDFVLSEELRDYSVDDIFEMKKLALELQEMNIRTLKNIDFRILQDKYLKLFDKNQLAQIVSYPVIQDAILNLDDNKLECLDIMFHDYLDREKRIFQLDNDSYESQWNQVLEKYLVALHSNQYTEIIEQIGNISNSEQKRNLFTKLGYIITNPNVYEIKTPEQLENYEQIRNSTIQKIMNDEDISDYPQLQNMDELSRKRFAIMQRYGIYSGYELSKMFDDDIEKIPVNKDSVEEKQINYILAIKELYKITDVEDLKEIFNLLEERNVSYISIEYNEQKILEKSIKLLYEKAYNSSLTKIDELKEISLEKRKQFGLEDYNGSVYEVDDEYNLIVTSVSPYAESDSRIDNFAHAWDRKNLKSQLACYSNINSFYNQTAPIPFTLLGFEQLSGIEMMAPLDNDSDAKAMTPFSSICWFTLPGKNNIGKFNTITEIDAKRLPVSYIPVQKKNGVLIQLENSIKAAEQFGEISEEKNNLPLVIIDDDRTLYNRYVKLFSLIQEQRKNPAIENLKEIAITLGIQDNIPEFYGNGNSYGFESDEMSGIMQDIILNDFSNTQKFVENCNLSKLVEYINDSYYAIETGKFIELEKISEKHLEQIYKEVPSNDKKCAVECIKKILDLELEIEENHLDI